jgi:hypothetical protein
MGNTEETTMHTRKQIKPNAKVGLKLTAAERKLILDKVMCLNGNYEEIIHATPTSKPILLTLEEWEDFGGYIAAEANHADDEKLEMKLDNIFNKVQKILDSHTDEEPPKTL